MIEPLVIELCPQKDSWDCGVACLAMLTSRSYSDIRAAIPKRTKVQEGLSDRQIRSIAKRAGVPLRVVLWADLQDIVGLLTLLRPADPAKPRGATEGHVAGLQPNFLFSTDVYGTRKRLHVMKTSKELAEELASGAARVIIPCWMNPVE